VNNEFFHFVVTVDALVSLSVSRYTPLLVTLRSKSCGYFVVLLDISGMKI